MITPETPFGVPWIILCKDLVMTNTKRFCFMKYPGHPHGCPCAHGRCWGDGKAQIPLTESIDVSRPIYIVFNEFNLEEHARSMKLKHPHWSDRQCRNLLYWQNTSIAGLKIRIKEAKKVIHPVPEIQSTGEGYGVNVYATCLRSGLKLDRIKDMKICRHLAIMGYRKKHAKTIFSIGDDHYLFE